MPKDERLVSIDQAAPMTSLRILLFSAVFEVSVAIADLIAASSGVNCQCLTALLLQNGLDMLHLLLDSVLELRLGHLHSL